MKDVSLNVLFTGNQGNFLDRYKKLKKSRLLLADSVEDFVSNKKNLETPLSDLFFLSSTNYRYIQFNNVQLTKINDDIHEFGIEEHGYTAKLYLLHDKTEETTCIWPTKGSKIPGTISCERFEDIKNFKGGLLSLVSIVHDINSENSWVYYVSFYKGKKQKRKKEVKELTPAFSNPLFIYS
ncbi:Uncharacterised protein [uncultured archaeon]|nr:Uncharacterised protein [uncultured archaeon]